MSHLCAANLFTCWAAPLMCQGLALGQANGVRLWGFFCSFGDFPNFYKEINPFSFVAFKVKLFFNFLMSEQYYLQSNLNPCLEGAAHRACAVYEYGPSHTGCVGWCVPWHSSCPTGAAPQALAVPRGVLPQHWLVGAGFMCV